MEYQCPFQVCSSSLDAKKFLAVSHSFVGSARNSPQRTESKKNGLCGQRRRKGRRKTRQPNKTNDYETERKQEEQRVVAILTANKSEGEREAARVCVRGR